MLRKLFPAAAAALDSDSADLGTPWGEQVVTAVGVALAVLIVASVAVLMGMA